jgi:acetyl-CoA carboxylase biotin carboxylase subunit
VHSTADRNLKHVLLADETVCIGPPPSTGSYLNVPAIISAAEVTDSQAIHPGYGFLSENADFAERVEKSGFVFIGPPPNHPPDGRQGLGHQGDEARPACPACPAPTARSATMPTRTSGIAKDIGYPVIIKAAAGGGGRGMRVVHTEAALLNSISVTKVEARAAFGNRWSTWRNSSRSRGISRSRCWPTARATCVHLGERDCSMQRRHQKVPRGGARAGHQRGACARPWASAASACLDIGYRGAGTFEFLYQDGEFYFIEMNTRMQVEHPVTEMITGVDIVKSSCASPPASRCRFRQSDIHSVGHAIECRINAEDPKTFMPSPGKGDLFHPPGGPGMRVDSHLYDGYTVPPYYDSMIAKIIAHGDTAPRPSPACTWR